MVTSADALIRRLVGATTMILDHTGNEVSLRAATTGLLSDGRTENK